MNHQLITELHQTPDEATLYFKNRTLQTNPLDLTIYQILSRYFKENGRQPKVEAYYELLRGWYYILLRTKEDEVGTKVTENEHNDSVSSLFSIFNHQTHHLSQEEKILLLYRYPWHLRTLLMISTGAYFEEDFVHQVASVSKLEKMDFEEVSYLAITPYDRWAIHTIQNNLSSHQEAYLTKQLTTNLSLIPYTLEHVDTFLKEQRDTLTEQDEQGLKLLTFLLNLYREEKTDMSVFEFTLFTLSSMCYWHFEGTQLPSNWFIKQGKFHHLKRFQEKIRKFR